MFGFNYPNVEVIKSINRYESFNAHKTNLYSIVVKTDIVAKARKYIIEQCEKPDEGSTDKKEMTKEQYEVLDRII